MQAATEPPATQIERQAPSSTPQFPDIFAHYLPFFFYPIFPPDCCRELYRQPCPRKFWSLSHPPSPPRPPTGTRLLSKLSMTALGLWIRCVHIFRAVPTVFSGLQL